MATTAIDQMRIIESLYLEEDGEPYEQHRTWRDRLFSRPWRPLQATRTVIPKVPAKKGVMLNAHTMVVHPQTWRRLKRDLESRGARV